MIKKGIKILSLTLLVYALLVATHQGEFWPFSIYPMFSQAGKPWTRALVRDISSETHPVDWSEKDTLDLPGSTFAMHQVGINQNDLANFISKNEDWSDEQILNLRKYFEEKLDQHELLIFKVQGRLSEKKAGPVDVRYTPYIYLAKDTTLFNPQLFESRLVRGAS